jgi:uncharacterized membrane protein YqaE (UPF0057 family)
MAAKNKTRTTRKSNVSAWRIIAAILLPPLAVIDKGSDKILIVLVLTLLGYLPGILSAFYFIYRK